MRLVSREKVAAILVIVAVLQVQLPTVAGVNQASQYAFTTYYNYAISNQLATTSGGGKPTNEACIFSCLASASCQAATYNNASGACFFLLGCAKVILTQNSTCTTNVLGNRRINQRQALIDMPLIDGCGMLTHFGSATLSSQPFINNPVFTALSSGPNLAAQTVLRFLNASVLALVSSSYVLLQDLNTASFDLFATDISYSVAFAFNPTLTSIDKLDQCMLGFFRNISSFECFFAKMTLGTPLQVVFGYSSACNTSLSWSLSIPVSNTAWNHVAVVYDSNADVATGYLNGMSMASVKTTPSLVALPTQQILIGNGRAVTANYSMAGSMICVQVHKAALTQSEVLSLSAQCTGGSVTLR